MIAHPSKPLSPAEADSFGRELDTVRERVLADLGQRDVDHIRGVIRLVRYGEVTGRALLHVGIDPLTFALGVAALGSPAQAVVRRPSPWFSGQERVPVPKNL